MKFRTDINALRALAVTAVMLFHFQPTWLPGGFVGVDIFFVISGYLMTKIIVTKQEHSQFSLINFYVARLNRIVPALAFLCFILFILGWFYLAASDYETLAKHVRYTLGFQSNQAYLSEAGYFDSASKEKWLLHTWSLSIEWQFYLFYPLILLAISKAKLRDKQISIITALLVISFIFCVYCAHYLDQPGYYLLSARAWEMLLGSWGVFYATQSKRFAVLGWGIIGASLCLIDNALAWPSLWTLLPAIGTLLVIIGNYSSKPTQWRIIQHLGLCSYSVYLWHWPIVVLFYKLELSTFAWTSAGISLSLLLGTVSYFTIEKISFKKDVYTIRQIFKTSIPLYLLVAGILMAKSIGDLDGVPHRSTLSPELIALYDSLDKKKQMSPMRSKCHIRRYDKSEPYKACQYFNDNSPATATWAIIGDSHASELSYSLATKLEPYGTSIFQYTFAGCPPAYKQSFSFDKCADWTNYAVSEIIENNDIQDVVIAYRYSLHLFGDNEGNYPKLTDQYSQTKKNQILDSLDNMVKDLTSNNKNVYLMMPIPEMGRSIQSLVDKAYLSGNALNNIESINIDYYHERNALILKSIEQLKNNHPNLKLTTILDIFCPGDTCYAVFNGNPLYFDDNHPGLPTTDLIVDRIIDASTLNK